MLKCSSTSSACKRAPISSSSASSGKSSPFVSTCSTGIVLKSAIKRSAAASISLDFESLTVTARYEVMARQIEALVKERYVSPLGDGRKREIVVNLVGNKEFNVLVKAGRNGEVSFRETRLGGCTKNGHCDYGGIESIVRCTGGDGDKPCREAIYDRAKQLSVERQLASIERRIEMAQPDSPRARALKAEALGLRKYLNVVRN